MLKSTDPLTEFRDQCRRNMARSVDQHIKYGFCYVYKPVMDDADYRVFNTMEEYRRWCHENLPPYLGYQVNDERTVGVQDA